MEIFDELPVDLVLPLCHEEGVLGHVLAQLCRVTCQRTRSLLLVVERLPIHFLLPLKELLGVEVVHVLDQLLVLGLDNLVHLLSYEHVAIKTRQLRVP